MNRAVSLKVLIVFAVSVALASTPNSSFAQRGGGGHGGGGFHGGGFGGSGFHGGGFGGGGVHGGGFGGGGFHSGGFGGGFGGFHNGGFNGFHGGFRGGWGFPGWWGWGGWGWGWGLDIGFGWPYWGWGYPYYYDYGPYAYGYPYYPNYPPDRRYDYRYAPDNRAPENREPDYRHDNSKPNDQTAPAKPSNTAVPGDSRGQNYLTRNDEPTGMTSGAQTTPGASANNFQLASSKSRAPFGPTLRPEVQNAIRLLRAMPPEARQERLNSSRYANFSPEERELLRTATQSPQLN
jgi:hypothetical protein